MPRWLALIALLSVLSLGAEAHALSDRDQVVAAIDRWDRGWQVKDPLLATQDYADDALWVNAFGMRRLGRKAIHDTLGEVFALPFVTAGNSETMAHDVRFLAGDVAVVATKVERKGQKSPSGEELGIRHTTHLRVFQKREDEWVILSHLISDARDTGKAAH